MQGRVIILMHCTPPKYDLCTYEVSSWYLKYFLRYASDKNVGRNDGRTEGKMYGRTETKLYFEFQVNTLYSIYLMSYCQDEKISMKKNKGK
jgi:hypothetical protein